MNTVYFAKHILLETGKILYNGAVSVCDGVIIDVGPRGKVRQSSDERLVNLGDILLLPGFINLHTHLEESPVRSFSKKEADETFTAWSSKKYSRMRQLTDEQVRVSIRLCVREMIAKGVTTVVDSSRTGISAEILRNEAIRSVVIREVADEEFWEESIEQVQAWQHGKRNAADTNIDITDTSTAAFKYGIGPHALYSLDPRFHRKLIEYSYASGCLWSCHVAESAEELQAFCEHCGDFFFNQTRKKPWPSSANLTPVQHALAENLIPSQAILYHCNYVSSSELALLAAKRAFITLCSGYSANMEHKSFPVEVARKRGIRICLGTEGMVPAGEMNLFDELFRLKMAYPRIAAAEMLQWVTQNPAAALKASDKLGSISAGKYADIIGVRFQYNDNDDILETLLMSDPEIALVMIGGEVIIIDR